ncbi:APC family permease [Kitasatospora sp. NPDC085879]|uniref:APC family permease n=1 Tax=Kitasatospora sp. NPDC085879 TaxID=3154769 RepID=UPI00342DA565
MSVTTQASPPQADQTLRAGSLGTGDITFFVVSAAAPLTVMAGVAPFALAIGGIGAPVAYLIAGAVLAVFAVGFTTMGRHVSNGGAFYAYITRGLGRPAGIAGAILALLAYNGLQIGMYGLIATSTRTTLHALFGLDVPWQPIALVSVGVVWFAGYRSIDFGAKVLGVLLVAETGILVLLAGGVLLRGGAHGLHLDSFAPQHAWTPGTGAVLAFAFAAFCGFESTAIYRSEARDPRRTVPRATYLAVGFLGLFYAFMVWTVVQAFGADGVLQAVAADPAGLFFTATTEYVGSWAADAMHVLIVTSVFASLLAFHNAITRYGHALAHEGVLPAALGRVHPRHRSPYLAGAAQSVLALVVVAGFALADADPYAQLLLWVNSPGLLGIVLLQALTAIAVLVHFRRIRHREGALRTVWAPAGAAVLLLGALYLLIDKIEYLTAAGTGTNLLLVLLVPAVLAVGLLVAARLRRTRPDAYARFAAETAGATASAETADH